MTRIIVGYIAIGVGTFWFTLMALDGAPGSTDVAFGNAIAWLPLLIRYGIYALRQAWARKP